MVEGSGGVAPHLRIRKGRENYTDAELETALLRSIVGRSQCYYGCQKQADETEPPAHPFPFDYDKLLKCSYSRDLIEHFAKPLVAGEAGYLPDPWRWEASFAQLCPLLTFEVEYENTYSGYPSRQFYCEGKLTGTQKMSLQWDPIQHA